MGDYAIRMQFDIDADREAVMHALTTADALERWWSSPVEGSPGEAGGRFTIAFPDVPEPFAFAVERPDDEFVWRTQEFPPWWAGTTIRWRVTEHPEGSGARLHFTHEGFEPDADIVAIITPGWVRFITALQDLVESGARASTQ